MSVRTTADELVENYWEAIKTAKRFLGELVTGEPLGWDDYSEEAKQRYRKHLVILMEIENS